MQLYLVQAVFLSCVSVSGLLGGGLKHAHKASGVLISVGIVLGRWSQSHRISESLRYGGP